MVKVTYRTSFPSSRDGAIFNLAVTGDEWARLHNTKEDPALIIERILSAAIQKREAP